ncbi:MAG TPA: hypothetical protein VE057_11895 [Archangium sp.]|nr:hypothetical protein [Archangium sp.]
MHLLFVDGLSTHFSSNIHDPTAQTTSPDTRFLACLLYEGMPQGKDRSHFYFAGLALRWMRGEPLPRLIDTAYDRRKKQAKRGSPSIGPVIRALMSEIDNDLGFRYVKYGRCYIDILQAVLRNTGNEEFIKRIPNIPLYLELGASSKTMVSLIGLGLSRTTAGILAEKSVNKELDTRAAEDWLKGKDFAAMGVPEICIHELEKIRRK